MTESITIIARYEITGSLRGGFSRHLKGELRGFGWKCTDHWLVPSDAAVGLIIEQPDAAPVVTVARGGKRPTGCIVPNADAGNGL